MRDRLIEIVDKAKEEYANDVTDHTETEYIVESLLNNGVVAPLLQTRQIVYRVSKGMMWDVKIWKIEICGKTISYIDNYDRSFLATHIGKGVFLTREQAEAKLKEGKG